MSALTAELEELRALKETAEFYGEDANSRFFKSRAKLIRRKYTNLAMEEAGLGDGKRKASGQRLTIKWGSETHQGVDIKAKTWEEAIDKAKALHGDVTDWEQDLLRAGKCKVGGELCDFKRWKGLFPGGGVFRIRVVALKPGLYLAQVCQVGRVDRSRARAL